MIGGRYRVWFWSPGIVFAGVVGGLLLSALQGCGIGRVYLPQGYTVAPLHPVPQQETQIDVHAMGGVLQDFEPNNYGYYGQVGGTVSALSDWLLFQGQMNLGYGGVTHYGFAPYGNVYLLSGLAVGESFRFQAGVWAGGFLHRFQRIEVVSDGRGGVDTLTRVQWLGYPVGGVYVGVSWVVDGEPSWGGLVRWLPGLGGGLQMGVFVGRVQVLAGVPIYLALNAMERGWSVPFNFGVAIRLK